MSFLFPNAACLNNASRLRRRIGTASILVALSFGILQAQEAPESARQFILDVGQRLEWSDNPDLEVIGEDRFTSRTTLQFGIEKRTHTDRLSLSLGGDLELYDGSSSDIDNANFGLGWNRDVGHSRTGITFDYREVDLGSTTSTFFNEDTGSIDFGTVDRGTRQTADLNLTGAFGVDSPFGGSYTLGQRQIRYSDTLDSDLLDADRTTFTGDLFTVINPRLTLGLETSYRDFNETGPGDRDTTSSQFGTFADVEITPRLTGRFGLGWKEVEETGISNNVEDGIVFDVALTQDLPRSSMTFGASSDILASGRRDEIFVSQTFDLPRNDLRYSLGLSRFDGNDIEPLIGLGWSQDLPRGAISFTLEQRATSGRDNENLINSRMSLGYRQELTSRSGFDVTFSAIDRNDLSATGVDTQRYNLDLTYRHALYEDWNLTSGISMVLLEEDSAADRNANTVFIGLEKRFVWN